ncbi:hypothetical protein OOT46_07470 [Aquabacterium sp. A7-Y]|uniref:hypothetical protein n=1 Tax=Aquabacterium sp. A7-Y TaxID=1349605 RepID=UPI00223CA564|nr:hypothetical protein [Aquabacterium sp. A7-Y]MCW7537688.1 hypothetical protein [Aquabacterium sp. A7-Y]
MPLVFAHHLLWLERGMGRLYVARGRGDMQTWRELGCATADQDDPPLDRWLQPLLAQAVGRWWRSVDVVLGGAWVRALTVDLGQDPLPEEVAAAVVAHRHTELVGASSVQEQLLYDRGARSGRVGVFACARDVIDQLQTAARKTRLSLRGLSPAAAWVVAHRARTLRRGAGQEGASGWTVYQEADRLVAVLELDGAWQGRVELPHEPDVAALRRRLQAWERRLQVEPPAAPLVLLPASGSGWLVEAGEGDLVAPLLPSAAPSVSVQEPVA